MFQGVLSSTALKQTFQKTWKSALSTESLKVSDPAPIQKSERIKYFKIYRWDPEQKQKPYLVSPSITFIPIRQNLFLAHHKRIEKLTGMSLYCPDCIFDMK